MKRLAIFAALATLGLSACAGSSQYYMGIDTTAPDPVVTLTPLQRKLVMQRQLLMLTALLDGCYDRTDDGIKAAPPERTNTFLCESRIAEIDLLNQELGTRIGLSSLGDLSVTRLAQMAQSGNKNAQLELGIRFEEGIGVERDLRKAKKLYRKAAADSGGTIWVYSPPVGNGTTGRVIPVNTGPKQIGLAEAKRRLERLE